MAAFETEPQMNPSVSRFHTIFADVLVALRNVDSIRMFAVHKLPSYMLKACQTHCTSLNRNDCEHRAHLQVVLDDIQRAIQH